MPSPAALSVTPSHVQVGDGHAATYAVCGYPAEVGPAWLDPLLSYPGRVDVAVHLDPVPPQLAAPMLKRQRARLESSRRLDADQGRLGDPMVEAAAADAADLAERVARGAAKLFEVGIYVTIHARTLDELATVTAGVKSAAASVLLDLQPATFRHQQGWISTLPVGVDPLRMRRILDTTALAAAFPLASADLAAPAPGAVAPPEGVVYGVNTTSNGVLIWNRWAQDNHNSVVLARSGAGKSYFVKLEVLRNLYQGTTVSVIDPEDEYAPLAEHVGGTVVQLGQPGVRINPLDLPADNRPDTLTRRGLYLHTLISVMLGTAPPAERAALDRAITATYNRAGINGDPATWTKPAPLLRDLAEVLAADDDPAAGQLAARLAPWTVGNFASLFDGPTTTAPRGHLVVWSLRHLPDELRTVGTLLALDSIWSGIDTPATNARRRRQLVVVDEAWLLMRDGEGARFLFRMAKAARKRSAGLCVITQDAADVLSTDLGLAVVSNAATQVLMRQSTQSIDAVSEAFNLTAGESRLLLSAPRGEGLLVAGHSRIPFRAVGSATEHKIALTGFELEESDR
ncbi:VirB4 family type IV secretion system protein [Micromonospora sp. NPDC005806]|uniref:VirB4 family type IV secretion system protein n=1 Tax=Micromonospora sp. NPDC005806 TaxID=3364234 RepID=UPI003688016C